MSAGRGEGARAPRRTATTADLRARRAEVEDPAIVLDAAAAFLAVRPRSVAETRQRLRRLGYRDDLIELALGRLVAVGYLDDRAFGRAWLESRDRARPRGEAALRRELRLKGLDAELVAALLAERSEAAEGATPGPGGLPAPSEPSPTPDLAAARRLLDRRASSLLREADPRRRRQRAYALLARNGFDPDTCREAVGQFLDGAAEGV